jgi:hypothetical protein
MLLSQGQTTLVLGDGPAPPLRAYGCIEQRHPIEGNFARTSSVSAVWRAIPRKGLRTVLVIGHRQNPRIPCG